MKESELTEHWAYASYLEHQPLDCFKTFNRIRWKQLAGFFSQIDQDGSALPEGHGFAIRAVWVQNCRNFVVRVQRHELRCQLIVVSEIHKMRFIREANFF